MAFFRKAGNMLGRNVSNYISQAITSSKPFAFQAIRLMSSSKLFIGGLSYSTDDTSLGEAFGKYGDVAEARVIVDRETGRSRGFGFVTYSSIEEASAAIQALNQQELHGRRIRVDYANDRVRGYGGGGFRGGNFGGGPGSYNSGGFGGSYGAGGGYNANDGYGGSENSNPRDGNYGSGTGFQGSTNYASNNGYEGGNLSYGGDSQDFGVAGGAGGSNDFFRGGAGVGSSGYGDKIGSEQADYGAGADEDFRQDGPLDENYRDNDDTPDNYADRRS